jgi:copper chaperone
MRTQVLRVKGMSCEHCKRAVESALEDLPGVADAMANLEQDEVRVVLTEEVSREALAAAIDEAGYKLLP